jgi:hypothetical protein
MEDAGWIFRKAVIGPDSSERIGARPSTVRCTGGLSGVAAGSVRQIPESRDRQEYNNKLYAGRDNVKHYVPESPDGSFDRRLALISLGFPVRGEYTSGFESTKKGTFRKKVPFF